MYATSVNIKWLQISLLFLVEKNQNGKKISWNQQIRTKIYQVINWKQQQRLNFLIEKDKLNEFFTYF